MTHLLPERWKEVSPYLDQALSLPEAERSNFVETLREKDPALANLLQTLLDQHVSLVDEQFLERSPLDGMSLAGQKLGPYQVEARLGSGGMGEVYRALDTRLSRTVAIKVLPPHFSSDPERRLRFEREAKAISAMQNPSICVLFDVGRQGGIDYLVMEYLEGETLDQWIERTLKGSARERLLRLLHIALQVARGLEAAHLKGIIHRDIKPTNIFITHGGEAKILDFGIAKSLEVSEPSRERLSLPAVGETKPTMTHTGLAVGTPLYLSPEQVKGDRIDARTDLFSFGIVLYEMATGRRAFAADSVEGIRSAILSCEPVSIRKVDPRLPIELERIVRKALSKECGKRYQSAADISADLESLRSRTEFRTTSAWRLRSGWTAGAAAVLLVLLIAGGIYYRSRPKEHAVRKDAIVLADFANSTGEKALDSALHEELSIELNRSSSFSVVSGDVVSATLQYMERPAGTPLVLDVARELCQRAGSRVYVAGSVAMLGSQYLVGLKAVNCRTGQALAQAQATATSRESLLSALDRTAGQLRDELEASLASLPRLDLPLEDVTTSSLPALEAFSTGQSVLHQKGEAAALPYHQRAIQLDPTFASAYSGLGYDYIGLGDTTRAAQFIARAFALRDRISRRENLQITAAYAYYVTGELDKAERAQQNLLANYPRLWAPHAELGGIYSSEGLYAKSLDEYRETLHRTDHVAAVYTSLLNSLLALQQFNEARRALEETQARNVDDYVLHMQGYALSFLSGDSSGMASQQSWFHNRPEVEYNGLALASDTEAFSGHFKRSLALTRQSVESAIRSDNAEAAAIVEENAALAEAAVGSKSEATHLANDGLKLAPDSQGVQAEAALALAMTGQTSRPVSLAKELEHHYPLDTQVHALWLSPIQAQLELDRRNSAKALAALPDIGALELGQISFLNSLTCLYRTYTRANALLDAGQGIAAASEFQKILDHSGMVWNCWTGALARLGLARAYALQARAQDRAQAGSARVRSRAAYSDFLALWKDADPDIPLLKQARSEYARLQQDQDPAQKARNITER